MKYFTKEELEDITRELLENPTRETLKSLNERYNGSTEAGEALVKEIPFMNAEAPVVVTPTPIVEDKVMAPQMPVLEETPVVAPIPTVVNESPAPLINPIPNFNIPNIEVPKVDNTINNNVSGQEVPFFELPKLEKPVMNNQNNEPVNFNGNLFEVPNSAEGNLMQTTDNFNSVPNTMPTTEVPVNPVPFFGPHAETTNNPIPVGGPVNNAPSVGPTMFGQLEQNYM